MKNKDIKSGKGREPTHGASSDRLVIDRIDQLKAIANPLRQQLFERFAEAPATTKQVADALGYQPTRLYHHVAKLEQAGLIELVSTRQVRGTTEKYFAATATTVAIDPALVSGNDKDLGVLDGVFGNVRAEIAAVLASSDLTEDDVADEIMFAQLGITASPDRIAAIRTKIDALIEELRDEENSGAKTVADAETQRLLIGWYPAAKKPTNS